MPSASLLISQAFNGLALGMLLALVSSGLTIILGTLGVLNLAHGALFMVGAYAIYVVAGYTGSFVVGVLAGTVLMLVLGTLLERGLIRWFYDRPPEDQLLVTFGAGIVIVEAVRAIFGPQSQHVDVPAWGQGAVQLGFLIYPTYRLELIGIVAVCSWACISSSTAPRSAWSCAPASRTRAWSSFSASTSGARFSWCSRSASPPPASRECCTRRSSR